MNGQVFLYEIEIVVVYLTSPEDVDGWLGLTFGDINAGKVSVQYPLNHL